MESMADWWTFDRVKVRRVIDGDTVDVTVDCGFAVFADVRLRLFGINAPEVKGLTKAAGLAAANQLRQLIPVGTDVRIETQKCTEKYGRWVAKIYRGEACVNDRMIVDGFAVVAEY